MYQHNQQFSQYYGYKQPDGNYHKRLNKTQGKKGPKNIISYRKQSSSQKSNENDWSKVKHKPIRRLEKNQSDPNQKTNIESYPPLFLKGIDIIDQFKLTHRIKKSPFKRILKSRSSCQTLYDPIERVVNVIKWEEKIREERKLHEKALRQLVFVPTYTELNDTFLNFDKIIKEAIYQRNANEVKLQENVRLNRLKKANSVEVNFESPLQKKSRQKISTQRVRCYLSHKQESQINHNKVRDLLCSMCVYHSQKLTPINQYRFPSLSSQNLKTQKTPSPKNPQKQQLNRLKRSNNNVQIQQPSYSHNSGSRSNSYISSSVLRQQQDYGFNVADIGEKGQLMNRKFNKVAKSQSSEQQRQSSQSRKQSSIGLSSKKAMHLAAENLQMKSQSSNSDYQSDTIANQLQMNSLQSSLSCNTSHSSIKINSKIEKKHAILKKLQENNENSNNSMMSIDNDSNLSLNSKKPIANEKSSDWRKKQALATAAERKITCGVGSQHAGVNSEVKQKAIRFIKVSKKQTQDVYKQAQKVIRLTNKQV